MDKKLGESVDSTGLKTLLAVLLLLVGIAIAYDTFFAEQAIKKVVKIDVNNLNPLSMFIKRLSVRGSSILYGFFSIVFAILYGCSSCVYSKIFFKLTKKVIRF